MKFSFLKRETETSWFGMTDEGKLYYYDEVTGRAESGESTRTCMGGTSFSRRPVTDSSITKQIADAVMEKKNETETD